MKKTGKSEPTKALLETADGMHRTAILSDAAHAKITRRHLATAETPAVAPLTPKEIRTLRENARMSQSHTASI